MSLLHLIALHRKPALRMSHSASASSTSTSAAHPCIHTRIECAAQWYLRISGGWREDIRVEALVIVREMICRLRKVSRRSEMCVWIR